MKGVDQFIHGGQAVFFCYIRQMCIAGCCRGACMAEDDLNMTKTQAAFKQMSGETVAKGVDMDFFLMPHSATTTFMAFWAPPLSI
jgi:hypothetical protein